MVNDWEGHARVSEMGGLVHLKELFSMVILYNRKNLVSKIKTLELMSNKFCKRCSPVQGENLAFVLPPCHYCRTKCLED